jgi:hypothetical protein
MQSSHCRTRSSCAGSNSVNTCSTGPRGEDGKVFERVKGDRWLLVELAIDVIDKDSWTGVTRSGEEAESVRVNDVKGFGFGRLFVCIYENWETLTTQTDYFRDFFSRVQELCCWSKWSQLRCRSQRWNQGRMWILQHNGIQTWKICAKT